MSVENWFLVGRHLVDESDITCLYRYLLKISMGSSGQSITLFLPIILLDLVCVLCDMESTFLYWFQLCKGATIELHNWKP